MCSIALEANTRDGKFAAASSGVIVRLPRARKAPGDAVHHGGEVERRRQVAADLGQRRGLARAALRLVEEPRVLQPHAHARGHRREQADLCLAEGILAPVVLHDDRAEHAVAAENGNEDRRMRGIGAGNVDDAHRRHFDPVVDDQRLALGDDPEPRSARRRPRRRQREPHAVLVLVEVMQQAGVGVIPADADLAGPEHLAQLVADQVDDGLEVEFGRDALLDAVDDRELAGVDQPFERLAQVRLARQMRGASFRRQPAPARTLDPGADDLPVRVDLVQAVAAQALVAQAADPVLHEPVRHLQRLARRRGLPRGLQRLAVPPPDQRRAHPLQRGQAVGMVQAGVARRVETSAAPALPAASCACARQASAFISAAA